MSTSLEAAIFRFARLHNLTSPDLTKLPAVDIGDYDAMYTAVATILHQFPPHLHEQLYETASSAIRPTAIGSASDSQLGNASCQSDRSEQGGNYDELFKQLREAVANEKVASEVEQDDTREGKSHRNVDDTDVVFDDRDGLDEVLSPAFGDEGAISNCISPLVQATETEGINEIASPLETGTGAVVTGAMEKRKETNNCRGIENVATQESALSDRADPAQVFDWEKWLTTGAGWFRKEPVESFLSIAGVFPNRRRRFGTSYFETADGGRPEDNADTIARKAAGLPTRQVLVAAHAGRRSWTKRERSGLSEAVEEYIGLVGTSIEDVQEAARRWEDVVWQDIVLGGTGGIHRRDPKDAKCFYLNSEASWLTTAQWTEDEDSRLKEAVDVCLKDAGSGGWVEVGKRVGGRSAFDALRRWREIEEMEERRRLKVWQKEEDKRLRKAVEMLGEGDWASTALVVGGRNGQQCMNRWRRIGEGRKTGKWDNEELDRLRTAVETLGTNWVAVAKHVGERSDVQCREKWVDFLDPANRKKGEWSSEEDAKLKEMVQLWGEGRWSKIAHGVEGRADGQCMKRWMRLQQKVRKKRTREVSGADNGNGTNAVQE